ARPVSASRSTPFVLMTTAFRSDSWPRSDEVAEDDAIGCPDGSPDGCPEDFAEDRSDEYPDSSPLRAIGCAASALFAEPLPGTPRRMTKRLPYGSSLACPVAFRSACALPVPSAVSGLLKRTSGLLCPGASISTVWAEPGVRPDAITVALIMPSEPRLSVTVPVGIP